MSQKVRRSTPRIKSKTTKKFALKNFLFLFFLLLAIVVTMLAAREVNDLRGQAAALTKKAVLPTPTPVVTTPTPTPRPGCNATCKTDPDCQKGLSCVFVSGYTKGCRIASCELDTACSCGPTPTATAPTATPKSAPTLPGGGYQIALSVGQFSDAMGETSQQFSLSGRTDPNSKVVVNISPDGVGGETTADQTGFWSFRIPKKLSAGQKQLLVLASKADGGTGSYRQSFIVVAGSGFGIFGILLVILILTGLGFGAYFYFKNQQI